MANTCTICRHKDRVKIDSALIKSQPLRDIALRFEVGLMAVQRHQTCVAELILETQKERGLELALDIDTELRRCFLRANKLFDACDEWLTDPDDRNKYSLDPRTSELNVIHEEQDGESQDGSARWVKKRATLSTLLGEVESKTLRVLSVESRTADPRKLVLDTTNSLNTSIDKLARLTGAYQQDRLNEHDRLNNRVILIEALFLVAEREGNPKTHEELEREADYSLRAVNAVWAQATEIARRKGKLI